MEGFACRGRNRGLRERRLIGIEAAPAYSALKRRVANVVAGNSWAACNLGIDVLRGGHRDDDEDRTEDTNDDLAKVCCEVALQRASGGGWN